MTVEQAIVGQLKATVAVTSLVAQRIWLLRLPQSPMTPAIRVQLIDEPRMYHLRGEDGMTRARVQVDVYEKEGTGDYYTRAVNVADAVDNALSGAIFTMGGRRISATHRLSRIALWEAEEFRAVRILQDYSVWSQPV